jgi:rare lipoprotein A
VTSGLSLARTIILLSAVLLTACGTTSSPPPSSTSSSSQPNAGRYQMENDSPLLGNKNPYTINGRTYRVMDNEAGYNATGFASWYGRKFHGHLTSNGEVYDMFQLSAAHTTLPIPSYIRVTNLDNGKSIVARVNDRGPFHDGRIVDLSYAGAVMLGYANTGTARVRVEAIVPGGDVIPVPSSALPSLSGTQSSAPVAPTTTAAPLVREALPAVAAVVEDEVVSERQLIEQNRGTEYLQVGAFGSEDSARALVGRLSRLTQLPVFVHSQSSGSGVLHKVRIGPVLDSTPLQTLIDSVQAQGLGTPFRVRVP